MELPISNTQKPVYSCTRTELLSLRTKTSLLCLSTVDRLKHINIGYHLPQRHRSNRGVKRKKQDVHPFIVASINAQSVKCNDIACQRCEISTFIKDNSVDLFFSDWNMAKCSRWRSENCSISTNWICRIVIATSLAISWRWNCYNMQIYFRLNHHIQDKLWFYLHIVRSSAGINYFTAQHATSFYVCTAIHQIDETILLTFAYWTAAWPSRLRKQPPRICLSC